MRVRVNQGKSVLHEGHWYDQRAEFYCADPKVYGDSVTVIQAPKGKAEPDAPKGEEK